MSRLVFRIAFAFSLLFTAGAQAQLFRAYLSFTGSDANPCTVAAPCRLLPAALNAVTSGGEIWMLDSANYNTTFVAISKSVSILAVPGAIGSFVAVQDGVNNRAMEISGSGVNVRMRNVAVVNNALSGSSTLSGILVNTQASLVLEDSVVAVPQFGLSVVGASAAVKGTTFRDATVGVWVTEAGKATIQGSTFAYNTTGVAAENQAGFNRTRVVISDSTFANSGTGMMVFAPGSGEQTIVSVMRSTFSLNGLGVQTVGSGATASVGESHFSANSTALQAFPGSVLETLGNNQARGNGTLSSGTITPVSGF
jgi:hypothetical protein